MLPDKIPDSEWPSIVRDLQKSLTGKGFPGTDKRQRLSFSIGDLGEMDDAKHRFIAKGCCSCDFDSVLGFIGPDLSVIMSTLTIYPYSLGGRNIQKNLNIVNLYKPNQGTSIEHLYHRHLCPFGGGICVHSAAAIKLVSMSISIIL